MSHRIFKSIGALLSAFMVSALLSVLTDFLLERTGVITGPEEGLFITWMIVLVLAYRAIYTIFAGWIVGRLAPARPMLLAGILGAIGVTLTILGTHANADKAPLWYGYSLAALTLPALWLGVRIARSGKPAD
jgi:hypothetical protein